MRFSRICIDRPVLSTVMSLAILIFGLVALSRLPNRELPDIDPPIVSVVTVLPGAAPEVIENSVTQVLEDEIMGIQGIKHVTSASQEEVSFISVEFELNRDVDVAAADVRDRVSRARRELPDEVKEPIVSKADSDDFGMIWIDLHGGGLDLIELSTLAETQLVDRLSSLPGVARVIRGGERRYAMRLWIDPERLTARGLVIDDVAEALRRENVDIPSGRVESQDREFTVRTPGEMRTAEQFNSMILVNRGGELVRLRDVGRAEVGAQDDRSLTRVGGVPAMALGIVKQSKANTLDVARAVHAEIEAILPTLPPGVVMRAAWDVSVYIEHSVRDVSLTIFYAIALVLVVIFVFLRSLRATLIPAISIPISVLGCLSFLYFFDFSINTLSLMGITLAIGLVVDDAIVVLENSTRWIEQGLPRMEAARRGIDEIAFAVVAASISVIAVFLPLAFLTDTTGRLFREFGITVAAAVAISGFVALTLSPAMCARLLRSEAKDGPLARRLDAGVERLRAVYAVGLEVALKRRRWVLMVAACWVALGVLLLYAVEREFVPVADRGGILTFIRAPEGSTLEYTDRYQREVEEMLDALPEALTSFSIVGLGFEGPSQVNRGIIFTALKPWSERSRSQQELVAELFGRMQEVPGVQAYPANEPTLGQDFSGMPLQLVVQGPDHRKVAAYADTIVQRAGSISGVSHLEHDLKLDKPQLEVEIDRERANDLGVSARDVASTLQILLGGLELSTFKMHGETYRVIAQLERAERSTPRDLYGLHVRGVGGGLVPLDSIVTVRETVSAPVLSHFDRMRATTVRGGLQPGAPLGRALEEARAIADEVLPQGEGYRIAFAGESEQFYESSRSLLFAYVLAVVLVYLVLAAQFESFVHPATILVAVALAFPGALLSLWIVHGLGKAGLVGLPGTLNLFSQIGLVMLVGLVTKNSILIVEFANQLRARGAAPYEAVRDAARIRFRPVLMTALSTMAGILPIALGMGAGGEARAPLGIAVFGGMAFATLLTFFVVPAVYLGFAQLELRWRRAAPASAAAPVGAAPQHTR